jgi:hypothetical protein
MKDKMKKPGELSDLAKHAKMSVLKNVHDLASKDMADKLKGVKKVSVMSDSEEGLAHGLDKAKEILGHAVEGHSPVEEHDEDPEERKAMDDVLEPKEMPEDEGEAEPEEGMEEEHEELESPEGDEHEGMSEEELDKKIAHLHSLKNKKRMMK